MEKNNRPGGRTGSEDAGQTQTPLAPQAKGVEGVRRYLASRDAKPMRGIDPEVIHAIHIGTEWEAELRMSDLRALAQQPAAVDRSWDELEIIVKGYLDDPHADAEHVLRKIAILAVLGPEVCDGSERNK